MEDLLLAPIEIFNQIVIEEIVHGLKNIWKFSALLFEHGFGKIVQGVFHFCIFLIPTFYLKNKLEDWTTYYIELRPIGERIIVWSILYYFGICLSLIVFGLLCSC
tara:strand:- start:458 stop:772 length:315 start_codon:yes stop_codon:yes gene_type:complete